MKKINPLRESLKRIPGLVPLVHRYREIRKRAHIILYNRYLLPRNLKRLKGKRNINIAFTMWNVAMWKCHTLYRLLEKDPRFNPFIIICKTPDKDPLTTQRDLEDAIALCKKRNYKIWPKVQEHEILFEDELIEKIDIILPVQPYALQKLPMKLRHWIFIYISYAFCNAANAKWAQDNFIQNIAYKRFADLADNIEEARKICFNSKNFVYTGYVFGDELRHGCEAENPWHDKDSPRLKIIYAPHFSIMKDHCFVKSNFLRLADDMLHLAEKYQDKIQIAFKPHPFLYSALCDHPDWGVKRASAYYQKWINMENTQLETGAYAGLFYHSDAIIHDCGSFTIEYLYTGHPPCYILHEDGTTPGDTISAEARECYYKAKNINDIEKFILSLITGSEDTLREKRDAFYKKYLLPPNTGSSARNVYLEICKFFS